MFCRSASPVLQADTQRRAAILANAASARLAPLHSLLRYGARPWHEHHQLRRRNRHDSAGARSPDTVEELQAILAIERSIRVRSGRWAAIISLTPCAASTGTVVSMDGLTKIVKIDPQTMTFTAQAGLQLVDAAAELRKQNLQFMLNIEIGNLTLGSAACCQTKDSLDGVELGQVNSYVTADQVGESVGRRWRRRRREESRAAAVHQGELRPGRHRLRGHVQDQAARDRHVRLRRPRRAGSHRGRSSPRPSRRTRASCCGRSATMW